MPKILKYLILAAFVVFLLETTIVTQSLSQFKPPHIKAPPYVPPPGCPKVILSWDHAAGNGIPKACFVKEYEFTEAKKYGFPSMMERNGDYYRIGNDVVKVNCGFDEKCHFSIFFLGVFHQ
ncbi:hypothetical protein [Novosphingobium sp.]|uniref:hypothetical protein n=1 Tax=Novosphingobium sp. TaxID=1874826 RepID=UPI003B52C19F